MTAMISYHRVAAIVIGEPRQLDGDLGWCALLTLTGSNGGTQVEITIFGETREAVMPLRYEGTSGVCQTAITRERAIETGDKSWGMQI